LFFSDVRLDSVLRNENATDDFMTHTLGIPDVEVQALLHSAIHPQQVSVPVQTPTTRPKPKGNSDLVEIDGGEGVGVGVNTNGQISMKF